MNGGLSLVRGQDRAVKVLRRILSGGSLPSLLIFSGPRGVGKSLCARIVAAALLCRKKSEPDVPCGLCGDCVAAGQGISQRPEGRSASGQGAVHPDLQIVDAAYQAGLRGEEASKQKSLRVDTARHLRRVMSMEALCGGWKVAILEAAQALEIEAANALLKILEEPPPRTLWILIADGSDKLPRPVLSRGVKISFAPLKGSDVADLLIEREIDKKDANAAARVCGGSVGRALEFLEARKGDSPLSPRDLPQARTETESRLFYLTQALGSSFKEGTLGFDDAEKALQTLSFLKSALRSNADPRVILTLAELAASPGVEA